MNLTMVRNAITSKLGRQILFARKHSPVVMFAAGTVGMIATVVVASRATLKLDEILSVAEKDMALAKTYNDPRYTEDDRAKDIIKLKLRTATQIGKLYAPAFVLGAVSVAMLTGSHVTMGRRNAGLMAAYAALDRGWKEYRARVVSEYGEEKDRELRYGFEERELVEETKTGPVVKRVKRVGINGASVYAKYFDEGSPNWDKRSGYNLMFLRSVQAQMNNRLHAEGYVFLNEVYEALGIKRTPEGALAGWVLDGGNSDNYIDFGCFDGSKQEFRDFVNGWNSAILLDFNVDGVIYDQI